ncbi:MAG: dihydroorotate dehydrogenase electron transfer subunit [Thermoanaerobacterales bacterium]|nr:dihydroorotate dehydrogenase electron transfer subunit [Bacillota bacterium]MDI6906214.1 dihydroorotate dehydrogenase electron transfer subunit [Thermoanaerobacterales bacterium]
MPPVLCKAPVVQQAAVVPGVYRLAFTAPEIARTVQPGQFVHLRVGSTHDPLLRRPFGVHDVDRECGTVSILFQVVGRGTAILAEVRPGGVLDVLGPLGRGFTLPAPALPVALVAGGLGIAPLAFLLRRLAAAGIKGSLFQGARTAGLLLGAEETVPGFKRRLATDDGTAGHRGSVVDLFTASLVAGYRYAYVYAAGPYPMLRALATRMREYRLEGEVSLEERMACGLGACLCCSTGVQSDSGTGYARVCADGPVFPVREVAWS